MPASGSIRALAARARRNARRAHAPYSGYRVGAVLEAADGSLHDGANIENAAYPLGFCAERVAFGLWRAASDSPVRRIVIWTESDPPGSPCGLCRDAIAAWAPDAEVFLAGPGEILGPFDSRSLRPGPIREIR